MGASTSWISVAGLSKAELLDRIGAVDTGCPMEWPRNDDMGFAELPSGRLLVISARHIFAPSRHHELSLGAEVVGSQIEEHVGYGSAWRCTDGHLLWSMVRDLDIRGGDLQIEGDPPPPYAQAWAKAVERGNEANVWGLPLKAASDLGRFEVGLTIDGWDEPFSTLEGAEAFMDEADAHAALEHKAFLAAERKAWRAANPGFLGFLKRILMLD